MRDRSHARSGAPGGTDLHWCPRAGLGSPPPTKYRERSPHNLSFTSPGTDGRHVHNDHLFRGRTLRTAVLLRNISYLTPSVPWAIGGFAFSYGWCSPMNPETHPWRQPRSALRRAVAGHPSLPQPTDGDHSPLWPLPRMRCGQPDPLLSAGLNALPWTLPRPMKMP